MAKVEIDTRLKIDKLDKDIAEIQKKLDKFRKKEVHETEINGIKVTSVADLAEYTEEEIKERDKLIKKYEELKQKKQELIEQTRELEQAEKKQAEAQEQKPLQLSESVAEIQKLKQEYLDTKNQMVQEGIDVNSEEAKKKLDEIKEKIVNLKDYIKETFGFNIDISGLDDAKDKTDIIIGNVENIKFNLKGLQDSVSNISSKLGGVVKKAVKWGLAIFSVRSAYMFIRQSVSTLSNYNEQLKVDLDYIRYAMANALSPVIEKLVNLAYTLLQYLNKITMSLFGLNIFADATAKNFASANKSAKELVKTIAPFDEMNIMSNSSGASGGGSSITPSVDLSVVDLQLENLLKKIEKFVSNIDWKGLGKKLGEAFTKIDWAGIGSTILSILWESLIGIVELFTGVDWGPVAKSVSKAVITWIDTITKKFAEEDWQQLGKDIMKGIVDWVTNYDYKGLAESISKLFLTAWLQVVPNLASGMITGLIDWILTKLGIQHDSEKIGNNIAEGVRKGMESIIEGVPFYGTIYKIIKLIKQVFGIHSPSKVMEGIGGNLIEGLKNGIKNKMNSVIDIINTLINKINRGLSFRWNDISIAGVRLVKAGSVNFGKIPTIPRLAQGGIVNRPTYAQIGEAGREAVLPLDRNTEWMNELAKKINANGGTVNVYLDGRLIQRQYNQRQEEFNFATNGGN